MLETPVVLLDNFDEDSQMLYQSMRSSGFSGPIITFSDDGYLPEDVMSVYTYYCGKKEGGKPNVIKLRNDGFEENTKNVLLFFCGKFEFFC